MTPAAEGTPQPPRISVIIVSHNRMDELRSTLETLGAAHQVLVVDNGSTDGTPSLDAEFPHVRFIRLPKNFGLTKAMNIGVRAAQGEYILFLHDDARITSDAVSLLADYLESHQDVGAVCPLLTGESGQTLPQMRSLPSPSDPDPQLQLPSRSGEVAASCVSGAAIMFRTFFLRALRQIDERYGTYGNIPELCAQVRRAGKKIVILSDVKAIHLSLPSTVPQTLLAGDQAAGTAAFLAKHAGFMPSLLYRLKTALGALFTFRFKVVAGAVSGRKIDGAS